MVDDQTSVSEPKITPASAFKSQNVANAEKYKHDIMRARAEGHVEGRSEARSQAIDFLHKKYMSPDIERGTPEAKALLQVAKELTEHLRGNDLRGKKKR